MVAANVFVGRDGESIVGAMPLPHAWQMDPILVRLSPSWPELVSGIAIGSDHRSGAGSCRVRTAVMLKLEFALMTTILGHRGLVPNLRRPLGCNE